MEVGWRWGAGLGAFRAFVRFVLVWICRFPLPLGVWEGLRFVIVALPELFSYFFGTNLTFVQFQEVSTMSHYMSLKVRKRTLIGRVF